MPFLDEDGVTRLTEDYLDIFAPKEELGEGDGTNAGPIYELSAKGHAEQFSTSGKNLLRRDRTNTNQTVNGITFVDNPDGSFTANGTATSDIAFSIAGTSPSMALAAATYTLSGCPSGGSSNIYSIRYFNNNSNISVYEYGNGATITLTDEQASGWNSCWLYISNGTVCNNLTFRPMLRLASITDNTYEPYTGGAPSPSPDYPQEIQVVRGRNLLDESALISGQFIYSNGTYTNLEGWSRTDFIEITAGATYTFNPNSTAGGTAKGAWYSDANTASFISSFDSGPITVTAPQNARYVRLSLRSESTNPQLELGSTPTPYVPYGHVSMEAQGKNLLPNNSMSQTINGITFTVNADGSITANGTSSAQAIFIVNSSLDLNGTYTLSGCPRNGSSSTYKLTGLFNGYWGYVNDIGEGFTFTGSLTRVVIDIRSGVSCNNLTFYPQLELGSVATPYEPYYRSTTPIPLPDRGWVGGLPDGTSDILTLDGAGKCEWEMETNATKISDLNWTVDRTYNHNRFGTNIADKRKPANIDVRATDLISDSYIANKIFAINGADVGYISGYQTVGEIFITDDSSDVSEFLSDRGNSTILYPLSTPIHESKGYIEDWPTDIPEGATITIPELDALNVKYFVANDSISQYAEQWYNRNQDLDIAQVEDAIGDLTSVVANLVTHDLFYFGYDEVNGKKMISIFKRGDV